MATVGAILIGMGVIVAIIALLTPRRSCPADAVWWSTVQELAPAAAARSSTGAAVAVNGTSLALDTREGPLTEPISGQACVWWRSVGAAHWEQQVPDASSAAGDQRDALRWEPRSSQLACSESDMPFELSDASGRVQVRPRDVRAEEVSRTVSRRDEVPSHGFLLNVGQVSFTADEDESCRGYYLEHVCEYIPVGVELLASGRVHEDPHGNAIGPDDEHGLQLCSRDFAAEQRALEVAVKRGPRVATVAAATIALAGVVVSVLAYT